ncbi:hypothetical protein [Streptomyces sp. NPDC059916]
MDQDELGAQQEGLLQGLDDVLDVEAGLDDLFRRVGPPTNDTEK